MNSFITKSINDTKNTVQLMKLNGYPFRRTFDVTDENIILESYRYAAKFHKHIRDLIKNIIWDKLREKENIQPDDIIVSYNFLNKVVTNEHKIYFSNELNYGIGFPMSISQNNTVGHSVSSSDDNRNIKYGYIYKFDIGVHCNGYLIDAAFTLSLISDENATANKLILINKDVMNAVKNVINGARPVYFMDISRTIETTTQERSIYYGINANALQNVASHRINRYELDPEETIWNTTHPPVGYTGNIADYPNKTLQNNTCYSMEPFITSGAMDAEFINSADGTSGYVLKNNMIDYDDYDKLGIDENLVNHKELYNLIKSSFNTLPFSTSMIHERNNIDETIVTNILSGNVFWYSNIITNIYPIEVESDAFVTQIENTFYVLPNSVEFFTSTENDDVFL